MSETVRKSQNWQIRSTYQQTDTGLVWSPPGFYNVSPSDGSRFLNREGIWVKDFELHNRSGSAIAMGIGGRLQNRYWVAGQWDDSDSATDAFDEDTTDAQDVGAGDFALETTTNNDGFVIASTVPFSWVSVYVTTAGVDGAGTTDREVSYSNITGSDWTTLTSGQAVLDELTSSNTIYSTGEYVFVWYPPADWGKTQAGGLSGIPEGMYALRVRTTDAPDTTVALAQAIEIGMMPFLMESVPDNGIFSGSPKDGWMPQCDALVAFFGTTNAGNMVVANVAPR